MGCGAGLIWYPHIDACPHRLRADLVLKWVGGVFQSHLRVIQWLGQSAVAVKLQWQHNCTRISLSHWFSAAEI